MSRSSKIGLIFGVILSAGLAIVLAWAVLNLVHGEDPFGIAEDTPLLSEQDSGEIVYNTREYYSLYDNNDLALEEKSCNKPDNEDQSCSYYQISGLKNAEVQNRINKRLSEIAAKYSNYDIFYENNTLNAFNLVSFYFYAHKNKEEVRSGITFDLNTGNELKLQDVFVKNANIKPLLSNAIYTRLVTLRGDYMYWRVEDRAEDRASKQEFDYDGEVLKILKKVDFNATDNFFLSPNSISFIVGDDYFNIEAERDIKYFGYYEKYASKESLFDNDDGLKNVPLSNAYSGSLLYNIFDETDTSTYTFEIINYYSWIENDPKLNQKLGEYYRKKIPNSDKYVVLQVGGQLRDDESSPLKLFSGEYALCEMDKTDYQNSFRKMIFDAKSSRNMMLLNWRAAFDANYGCKTDISSDPVIIDADNNLFKLSDAIKEEFFTDTYCPYLDQNKQADCKKNFDKYFSREYIYESYVIKERNNASHTYSAFIPDEIPHKYFNKNVKF